MGFWLSDIWRGLVVLSAKFGFVLPTEEVENYNVTLKYRSADLITPLRLVQQIPAKGLQHFFLVRT